MPGLHALFAPLQLASAKQWPGAAGEAVGPGGRQASNAEHDPILADHVLGLIL
jgi:hypothetical protein